MFGWLSQWFRTNKEKARQLRQREVKEEPVVQDETPQQVSSSSVRSLLRTAIVETEQIAASIKMRAQTEAEAEAARIIAQAKLEAEETKGSAEITAQREAEDILSAAKKKAEVTEAEAKQTAIQFLISVQEEVEKDVGQQYQRAYSQLSSSLEALVNEGHNIVLELRDKAAKLGKSKGFELKGYETALLGTPRVPPAETLPPAEAESKPDIASKEEVEEPVQLKEETPREAMEQPLQPKEEVEGPVQLKEEAVVSGLGGTTEEPLAQQFPEESSASREQEPTELKLDRQALYSGEVELVVASPVELNAVSRLYNYLQTIPELKVLYTRGSWNQGTTITVVLEKPLPLISIISETPGVKVTPTSLIKNGLATGRTGSPLRGAEKRASRIELSLKEA